VSDARPEDRCLAPLVVHRDGYVACLDDDCVVVEELHVLLVDCDELDLHGCDPGDR
jgi:hypothetical protein